MMRSRFLRRTDKQLVVLIRTDQQGGAEVRKAFFSSAAGGFLHAQAITGFTPILQIGIDGAHKGAQPIIVVDDQFHLYGSGILLQGGFPTAVLGVRVNIGVVPISGWFHAFVAQNLDTPDGAGSAANVKQTIQRVRHLLYDFVSVYHILQKNTSEFSGLLFTSDHDL